MPDGHLSLKSLPWLTLLMGNFKESGNYPKDKQK